MVISDIHFGHSKNKAINIVNNFKNVLRDDAITNELDIIFIAGDVYDTLLTLPSEDAAEVDMLISYLINICACYNISLRILEGTPSHDWKQSKRFIDIAYIMKSPIDIKYIKELSIEYIERFDIHVLYVPDEWSSSTEKTLNEVYDLLKAKGLEKVDYAIMHGIFPFQLPEHVKVHKHDSEAYLKLVRELIFIGHIHTYSTYDRIIAQGSFDRISHGEEEPKGFILATITNDDRRIQFIENKNAKIFKTIDCTYLNIVDTINKIDNILTILKIPTGSFIRVLADTDNPILANMDMLIRKYPTLMWSKLAKDNKEEIELFEDKYNDDYIPITITNENIKQLLLDRISFTEINSNVIIMAEEILDEII